MLFLRPRVRIQKELVSCCAGFFHRWASEAVVSLATHPSAGPRLCWYLLDLWGDTLGECVSEDLVPAQGRSSSSSPFGFVEVGSYMYSALDV